MFKTLAILAVSMTATTVLLTQLEPASSRANPHHIQQFVRSAVAGATPIVPDSWAGVEIVLGREVTAYHADALAAVPDAGDYHFRIDGNGDVKSSPTWRQQRPASVDGAIRIALADQRGCTTIAPVQWEALRMLLVELRGGVFEASAGSDAVPWWVMLSDEAADDTVLQAHLRSVGLHG